MSLHDNASLSVSKLYQTNLFRSIIFRIIIILVFIIVRYIPNYITFTSKITQYDTNNNYYIRMYIDNKKRPPHTGMEVSYILSSNSKIYYLIRNIWRISYFIVHCFQKQLLNRQRLQEYNPQSTSLKHTSILV